MGHTETALTAAGSALFDDRGSIDVALLNDGMELTSRSDAELANGANLALIGDELIQFGVAEPLGAGRYRLRRLLRGRSGTEWACATHAAGEPFLLIDRAALTPIEVSPGAVGAGLRVTAAGRDDGPGGVTAARRISGEAVRPPSPVHLLIYREEQDVQVSWIRRSRAGWPWLDGTDAPLGEEQECYELTISGANFVRQVTRPEPRFRYTAAEQQADGAAGAITVQVVQTGTHARSRGAIFTFLL
jgi:hypothetical protein